MADEVEISRDDLLDEAKDFLKTAKDSANPEEEYNKYKNPALKIFYKKKRQDAVLDMKVIGQILSDFDPDITELFAERFYDEEPLFENRTMQYISSFKPTRKRYFYFEPEDKFQSGSYSFNVLLAHVLAKKKGIKLDDAVQQIKLFADPLKDGKYALKFDQGTIDDHMEYVATLSVSEDEISESNLDLSKGSPSVVSDSSSLELDPGEPLLDDSQRPSPAPSDASSGVDYFPTFHVPARKASPLRLCVVSPAAGTADNPITV